MKFQEIDFHVELFKAYLEPTGAQIDYLEMLRKQSKYNRDTFLVKLRFAYDNIQKAYKIEVDHKKSFILNWESEFDLQFPISFFRRYPILTNFVQAFSFEHQINRKTLEDLSYLITSLDVYYGLKKLSKTIGKLKLKEKEEDNELGDIENKFNQMPMEEVRDHFLPLTKLKNRKKEIWMTEEDFKNFLRRSFGMQTNLSKPKINIGYGGKYAIVKLFYQFYGKCQNESLTQDRIKDPFIDLLKNAFDTNDFDDLTNNTFQKRGNKTYDWN